MLCELAARNQWLMFLQLYPSYVDAHEVIATAFLRSDKCNLLAITTILVKYF